MQNSNAIVVNTCNARHELALLNEIISQQKWKADHLKANVKSSQVYWLAGPNWFNEHAEDIRDYTCVFNKLPGMDAASNKVRMAQIFSLVNTDFIPRSFQMPGEADSLRAYMK